MSKSGDDQSVSHDQVDESHDESHDNDRLSNAVSSDDESTADRNMVTSSDDYDGDSDSEIVSAENPDLPITVDGQVEDHTELPLQLLKGKRKAY